MTLPALTKRSSAWKLHLGERRLVLIAGDFLMAVIALLLSLVYWGTTVRFIDFNTEFLLERIPAWFYWMPVFWIILLVELYDVHRAGSWSATLRGVAAAALIGFGVYLLLYFYYVDPPKSLLPRRGVASFLILASLLTLLWRWLYIRIFTGIQFMRRVLVVGGGKTGEALLQTASNIFPPPFYVVGIIDDDPEKLAKTIEGYPVLGGSDNLLSIADKEKVTDIIVAITGEMQGKMFQSLLDAQECGIQIIRMPKAYERLVARVPIRMLEADWILRSFVDELPSSGFYEVGKRSIDLLGGLIGTAITVVLFPFFDLAILIDDGRPVIFTQTRSGR